MSTNEGWYFEGPDPEVGLFGDTVVHEDCPATPDGDDLPDLLDGVTVNSTYRVDEARGLVTDTTTYTCTRCGSTATDSQTWPQSYFEEPRP